MKQSPVMTSADLRASFVDFFAEHGHRRLPSASLVPTELATTLFTIAGMEPFVPIFLGEQPAPAPRAVTVQRCLRVAGAKSDIENVGRTGRHGTFLEMLGNFGFADYGKREAITWAWQYLTERLRLDPQRLYVTVHLDDDEAHRLWVEEIGLDSTRISRFDEDNFWTMGPTGPCGPSSELFYDTGEAYAEGPDDIGPNRGSRYLEIWNLVFQQFNREADGRLRPLAALNIDTGAGLERLLAVVNGHGSIYQTDLFTRLVAAQPEPTTALSADERLVRQRIIADHARAVTALIADKVLPGNADRGYVLRFLIRRAIRNARLLGYPEGSLSALVPTVIATLVNGFDELSGAEDRIVGVLRREEEAFERTLMRGEALLDERLTRLAAEGGTVLAGGDAFILHDTYGFPLELTEEILGERGLTVDRGGFTAAMEEQRRRARSDAAARRGVVRIEESEHRSTFVGYAGLESEGTVQAILGEDGSPVSEAHVGERIRLILDKTSFYAERGGQIGDHGRVTGLAGDPFEAIVDDTQPLGEAIVHHAVITKGRLSIGQSLTTRVDADWRREIRRHHTAVHLLQTALRTVLGDEVVQAGSWVGPERLRFDFRSPHGAPTAEQCEAVARLVNTIIRDDYPVSTEELSLAEAQASGAIAMTGEIYREPVRVLRAGPSLEFCGGTHAERTGEIGLFVLLSESSIGSGVRRIEALVSAAAERHIVEQQRLLTQIATQLAAPTEEVANRLERLLNERRADEQRIQTLRADLALRQAQSLTGEAVAIAGVTYLGVSIEHVTSLDELRLLAEAFTKLFQTSRPGPTVLALIGTAEERVHLLILADRAARERGVDAGALLRSALPAIEGKGGGSGAQAQGGGRRPEGIAPALEMLRSEVERQLSKVTP